MEVQSALKHQYHAALKTLRLVIERCPDELWDQREDERAAPFWQVAYHTLFFTHFYLQQTRDKFKAWEKGRKGVESLGRRRAADAPGESPDSDAAYTREEILEYWRFCDEAIDTGVDRLDLSAAQCGFPWYKMPTLEHQLVNIRHIQHHAAALAMQLRNATGVSIEWVGRA